jgi:hypothetical protein
MSKKVGVVSGAVGRSGLGTSGGCIWSSWADGIDAGTGGGGGGDGGAASVSGGAGDPGAGGGTVGGVSAVAGAVAGVEVEVSTEVPVGTSPSGMGSAMECAATCMCIDESVLSGIAAAGASAVDPMASLR